MRDNFVNSVVEDVCIINLQSCGFVGFVIDAYVFVMHLYFQSFYNCSVYSILGVEVLLIYL